VPQILNNRPSEASRTKGRGHLDKDDIDPKVREVWKMQFRPIDEVVRDIRLRDAKEEGKEEGKGEKAFEVARKMLDEGLPAETIRKCTGIDESSLLSLR
jgi:hypothetical protein